MKRGAQRLGFAAVVVTASAVLVSACGGAGGATSGNSANGANGGGSAATNMAASGATAVSNRTELDIGLTAYPITMDPLTSSAWFDRQVMYNIYDTLFQLGPQNQIEPDLVQSYTVSPDGKTYTLNLHTGITFQDGTPFNAAAVKFNLERYMGPTSTSRSALTSIASIDTPDDHTVVIHLKQPFSPLLSILTDRAGMMVSPTAVRKEGKNFGLDPVGTGPFEYKSSLQGDHITLVKNPHYWQPNEPKLDMLVFKAFTDPNVELQNLESGAVQIIDSVPPQQVQSLEQNQNFRVISQPSWAWAGYGLNTQSGPFKNLYLREAVNEAIDRSALVRVVLDGQGVPGFSALSPASPGYDKQADTAPAPNPAEIKGLLAKGGEPNGFSFTLKTLASDQLTAQTVQSMLAQYGIQMKIDTLDAAALGAAQDNHNFDAILEGWSGRLDPDQNMSQYFYTNGPLNWVGYSNPEVDQLLTQARAQQSMADRQKTYAEITAILQHDAPAVFLYHKNNILAMAADVQGFPYRSDGMVRAATVYFGH
ncbi:MAG: peptide ABC transporter substrate-binding protein [Alicyclobacillus sp.]|nr:peptide ABC transporter substrate-binding protein [Alicyclobacillus sp.]